MGKILGFILFLLPLAITAQPGGGFGGDFERPEGGGPPGRPPMGGRDFNPSIMPDSLKMQEQTFFETAFASADIINRNAETFISLISPLISLPQVAPRWGEIREALQNRGTQGEKNEALKLHRKYLTSWDTLVAALDSVLMDSLWLKEKVRNTTLPDSFINSVAKAIDSMPIALEMNRKSSTEIEARLHKTREMFSKLNSNSDQSDQASASKNMLFTLKVDIINMENNIEILNRESQLGEKILASLDNLR